MRYRRVTHRPDRILVDYTYTSSFKIATPGGDRWETRLRDNRIELVRKKRPASFQVSESLPVALRRAGD
jgi:hypothetical protein